MKSDFLLNETLLRTFLFFFDLFLNSLNLFENVAFRFRIVRHLRMRSVTALESLVVTEGTPRFSPPYLFLHLSELSRFGGAVSNFAGPKIKTLVCVDELEIHLLCVVLA